MLARWRRSVSTRSRAQRTWPNCDGRVAPPWRIWDGRAAGVAKCGAPLLLAWRTLEHESAALDHRSVFQFSQQSGLSPVDAGRDQGTRRRVDLRRRRLERQHRGLSVRMAVTHADPLYVR